MRHFRAFLVCLLLITVCFCFGCGKSQVPVNTQSSSMQEMPVESENGTSSAQESDIPESKETVVQPTLAEQLLKQMTLHEKICQMFIVRPESLSGGETVTEINGEISQMLAEYPVGGVTLFSQNILTPQQCQTLITELQQTSSYQLFVSVDEEGGAVARLGNNAAMNTTPFPHMMNIGDMGDVSQAYRVGYTIGTEIAEFGFNLDFAPVADVATNVLNSVIGSRAFSSDPQIAAAMVSSAVKGFSDAGMICTLKHFPGHGDTTEDSHTDSAVTYKTLQELRACEFLPFSAGIEAGSDMVMAGHIIAAEADGSGLPASMSRYMLTDILRDELGFKGVIITDSLEMEAITDHYSQKEATVMAVDAGVDIILMPAQLEEAVDGLESAVENGLISEQRIDESVLRILQLKEKYHILSAE